MSAQEKDILVAILVANAFISLLAIIYFVSAYFIIKKNKQLQLEKLRLELSASESARQQIATQLHNDLGPLLSSVNLRLELVRIQGPEHIDICQQTVSKSVQMIRQLTRELSPFGNLHITLKMALEQYIADQFHNSSLQFNIIEKDLPEISAEKINQIYRILQEIIQNTIKHAQAHSFDMEICVQGKQMQIRTSDDGIGYDQPELFKNKNMGCGINEIYNRVELLDGEIECQTGKGLGTKYHLLFPV